MREKIVSINRASVNWISVAHAICVPCWFSIEGCEGGVREPSCCFVKFVDSVDSVLK